MIGCLRASAGALIPLICTGRSVIVSCRIGRSARSLLELAADAFVACRVSPDDPLDLDGLDRRLYPEWPARGNTAHQKRRYALQAAILIAVGVEPEDASWWRHDDLWSHAFDAVIVFVRAAAERRAVSVAEMCDELRANVR